jgi:hypothetical protein
LHLLLVAEHNQPAHTTEACQSLSIRRCSTSTIANLQEQQHKTTGLFAQCFANLRLIAEELPHVCIETSPVSTTGRPILPKADGSNNVCSTYRTHSVLFGVMVFQRLRNARKDTPL